MDRKLSSIARNFQIAGEVYSIKPLGDNFINDTYYVSTLADHDPDYLFQKKNKSIFKDVPAMMENINNISLHLKKKVTDEGGDATREAMTLIRTKDEKLFYLDEEQEFWTMTLFIRDSFTYEASEIAELAFSGGKGIGKFHRLCSDYNSPLKDSLPNLHNMRYRLEMWDKALSKGKAKNKAKIEDEILWIGARREEMLQFWTRYEQGSIPTRVTHNDPILSNILFDKEEGILCMIDLDTVMNGTILFDFGDAIRSFASKGKEDDVNLDIEMYSAFTLGYLEEASSFLSDIELEHLAFSAKYITFEQVLLSLTEYLETDTTDTTKSAEHKLFHARAQLKLLQSMEDQFDKMKEITTAHLKQMMTTQ